ncbi:hypothetical protein MARI_08970 [Marinobacter sp. JH2]|nr:hypothetical protein MARI_08970 [Marinobacter sp. JH2]
MKKNGAFVNLFLSEANIKPAVARAELAHGTLCNWRKLLDKAMKLL